MLFSPFDALGLLWGDYSPKDIERAYRRASLVCHPDKRLLNGIDPDRWPQIHHLKEAVEFLTQSRTNDSGLNKFRDFPQTFFPLKKPYLQNSQLPCDFQQCHICQVVVLEDDLNEHLRDHQQAVCPECDKRTHLDEINEHLERIHQYQKCRYCSTLTTPAKRNDHIANYHKCPLCDAEEAFLIYHLCNDHQLRMCSSECGSNDPVTHIITKHPASECPGCSSVIFDDVLLDHLRKDHGLIACYLCHDWDTATELMDHVVKSTDHGFDFCPLCTVSFIGMCMLDAHLACVHNIRPCKSCPPGEHFNMDHIIDHALKFCPECDTDIESDGFQTHLITHHKWILCGVCNLASPDEQTMQEHKDLHPVCKICNQRITQERLQGHLQTVHGLLCCPLCDSTSPPADLPRHFQTAHNQTESCPECHYIGTKVGLKEHVIEFHGWLQCRFCDEVFNGIGSKASHEEDVHDTKPCWHCDQTIPEGQMRLHQISEHGYEACPFCPSLSKELPLHIDTHQQKSAHLQLSAIKDQLRRFAALETSSKELLHRAVKLIEEASCENQNSNPNPQRFASSQAAQNTQTQGTISSATQMHDKEAGKPSACSTAEEFPGQGEESNLGRPSRLGGCKRTSPSDGSAIIPRKKTKTSVHKQTGLNEVLEKITCNKTVRGFLEAVTSNNHPLDPLRLQELSHTSQSAYQSISLMSQIADKCELKVNRGKMQHYYALLQMARLLDHTKKGRQRLDSAELDRILEHKKCGTDHYNRNKLRNQLQLGRKLEKITGPFEGLLCFLVVGQADLKSASFAEDELGRFHDQLHEHKNLWAAGGRFLSLVNTRAALGSHDIREITSLVDPTPCTSQLEKA